MARDLRIEAADVPADAVFLVSDAGQMTEYATAEHWVRDELTVYVRYTDRTVGPCPRYYRRVGRVGQARGDGGRGT